MGPSEIDFVQISRTKYIMKCYHDTADQIPPKRILWLWNQRESHCLHWRPHIWNSRTSGASRYQNTRELPLEQKVNHHQVGNPIKRHTDLFKYGYISYVKNSPFSLERTVCHRNSAFKHTTALYMWRSPRDRQARRDNPLNNAYLSMINPLNISSTKILIVLYEPVFIYFIRDFTKWHPSHTIFSSHESQQIDLRERSLVPIYCIFKHRT